MTGSVALDVVIGLVFIYLLYSLFASILAEIIATYIGLRARNLREAVDRMLNDEPEGIDSWQDIINRFWDSFKLLKKPTNARIRNFYNHPEIKYLGSTGIFRNPSSYKAVSFSKTLLFLLNETGYRKIDGGDTKIKNPHKGDIKWVPVNPLSKERIDAALIGINIEHKELPLVNDEKRLRYYEEKLILDKEKLIVESRLLFIEKKGFTYYTKNSFPQNTNLIVNKKKQIYKRTLSILNKKRRLLYQKRGINEERLKIYCKSLIILDEETAKYIHSLWYDSDGDIIKFKLLLEAWFDRTMEQALEWYKRKIQVVLLILGFFLAWFFNVSTFSIIKKLSVDKDAREKMVNMASAYVRNNSTNGANMSELEKAKLDTVLSVKRELEADINEANSTLGLGSWLPDKVEVLKYPKMNRVVYVPNIDGSLLKYGTCYIRNNKSGSTTYYTYSTGQKFKAFFLLPFLHLGGYIITAIAISLGAPFWFDLLNKLMRLRTSVKHPTSKEHTADNNEVSPLRRLA